MRYLVLSDIHSNLEAFTAVLQRVRRKRFDRTVILGDLVGYGADPNPIVDRVRKLKRSVIIRGNHDKVCSGIENGEMFNKVALQSARWTENQLLPRHRKWLRALPKGPVTVGDVLSISHGTPLDEDAYIFGEIEALNMFQYFETPICFFGHSHFPVVFGLDDEALTTRIPLTNGSDNCRIKLDKTKRYLINPGSIGQPRDGDNRASFGVLDDVRMTMTIYRVEYPYEKTQEKIRAAGLPAPLADRLAARTVGPYFGWLPATSYPIGASAHGSRQQIAGSKHCDRDKISLDRHSKKRNPRCWRAGASTEGVLSGGQFFLLWGKTIH